MPIYRVSAKVVGSKVIGEFKARNRREAVEMARKSEAAVVCMCHQCTDEVIDPECTEFFSSKIRPEDATPVDED